MLGISYTLFGVFSIETRHSSAILDGNLRSTTQYASRTHGPGEPRIRRILEAGNSGKVGARIGAPIVRSRGPVLGANRSGVTHEKASVKGKKMLLLEEKYLLPSPPFVSEWAQLAAGSGQKNRSGEMMTIR